MYTATKYETCASLAKHYDMQDVSAYRHLADEMLENLCAVQSLYLLVLACNTALLDRVVAQKSFL